MRVLVGVRYLNDEVDCCDFQIHVLMGRKVLLDGRLDDCLDELEGLHLALPWMLVLLRWRDELMVQAWYRFALIWEPVSLRRLHQISLMVQC